jgi:hypothetical protein
MLKSVWATKVTDSAATDVEGVGSIRVESDNKMYRWVKNSSASVTFAAGDVAFHDYSEGADAMKSVQVAAAADLGFMAGVVASTSIAANTGTSPKCYGWVLILGYVAQVNVTLSTSLAFAAGHHVKGVDGNVYATYGQAMGTAPIYRRSIMLLDAAITMATPGTTFIKGFVHCV